MTGQSLQSFQSDQLPSTDDARGVRVSYVIGCGKVDQECFTYHAVIIKERRFRECEEHNTITEATPKTTEYVNHHIARGKMQRCNVEAITVNPGLPFI